MFRVTIACFVLLLPASFILAADPEPKDLIAKGLTARGLKDDGKSMAQAWKDSGVIEVSGLKIAYTAEFWFRPPDALRFELAAEVMDQKLNIKSVTAGENLWDGMDGKVEEVKGEKKDAAIAQVYTFWVSSLTPLNHDKAFKLSTVVGKPVNEKPTHGVLVERKGKPEVTLYFDKQTGLLVKTESTVKDEFQGWKDVLEETFYEGYKEAGGVKEASKLRVLRDGKPFIESNPTDYRSSAKLDPKLFEKP